MAAQIAKPDERAFSSNRGYYLQALAQPADGVEGILNKALLRNETGNDQSGYLAALAASNQAAATEAERDRQSALANAEISAVAPQATAGIAGAVSLPDNPYLHFNTPALQTADAVSLNKGVASAQKDRADALGTVADKVGYLPDKPVISSVFTSPLDTTLPGVKPNMTPDQTTARMTAEAAQTSAGAAVVRANKPGGGDGANISLTMTPSLIPGLPPTASFRGKNPAAVQAASDAYSADPTHKLGGAAKAGGGKAAVDPAIAQKAAAHGLTQPVNNGDGTYSFKAPDGSTKTYKVR